MDTSLHSLLITRWARGATVLTLVGCLGDLNAATYICDDGRASLHISDESSVTIIHDYEEQTCQFSVDGSAAGGIFLDPMKDTPDASTSAVPPADPVAVEYVTPNSNLLRVGRAYRFSFVIGKSTEGVYRFKPVPETGPFRFTKIAPDNQGGIGVWELVPLEGFETLEVVGEIARTTGDAATPIFSSQYRREENVLPLWRLVVDNLNVLAGLAVAVLTAFSIRQNLRLRSLKKRSEPAQSDVRSGMSIIPGPGQPNGTDITEVRTNDDHATEEVRQERNRVGDSGTD